MVTERHLEKVGVRGKRKHCLSRGAAIEWRVLENGVLAVKTPLEVVTPEGKTRCIWFEPRKKRLVCPHGWGQYHLGIWNGPRAADFPKPAWTTCDCKSATGLCARQKLREEVASGSDTGQSIERIITAGKIVPSDVTVGLLQAAMAGAPGPFLIDGFPRSLSNLHAFEAELGPCEYMLFLEVALARCIAAPAPRVARLRGPAVRARALARVRAPLSSPGRASQRARCCRRPDDRERRCCGCSGRPGAAGVRRTGARTDCGERVVRGRASLCFIHLR